MCIAIEKYEDKRAVGGTLGLGVAAVTTDSQELLAAELLKIMCQKCWEIMWKRTSDVSGIQDGRKRTAPATPLFYFNRNIVECFVKARLFFFTIDSV